MNDQPTAANLAELVASTPPNLRDIRQSSRATFRLPQPQPVAIVWRRLRLAGYGLGLRKVSSGGGGHVANEQSPYRLGYYYNMH